jgi:exonuclease-1
MGIQGLLPTLKSITSNVHVSKYRGKSAAVDAYGLLHKGAYSCARELVEGEPTDKYVPATSFSILRELLPCPVHPVPPPPKKNLEPY